jgi:hypothetical protein
MLGYCINKYMDDTINTKCTFSYYDINNISSHKWSSCKNKINTFFCINSIMHFNIEYFNNYIEKIADKNAILIFNCLEMANERIEFNDIYFIERLDDIVKYKFPVHNNVMTEKYINIEHIISKYNWKILNTYKSSADNITCLYRWYVVQLKINDN